jgi:hypothetical protein
MRGKKWMVSIGIIFLIVLQFIPLEENAYGNITWKTVPIKGSVLDQDPNLPAFLRVDISYDNYVPTRLDFNFNNFGTRSWYAIWLNQNGSWIKTDRFKTNVQGNAIGYQDPIPSEYYNVLEMIGSFYAFYENVSDIPPVVVFHVSGIQDNATQENYGVWGIEVRTD